MDYLTKWMLVDELGEGGQGKVYRVIDISKFDINAIRDGVSKSIGYLSTNVRTEETIRIYFDLFRKTIADMIQMEDVSNHCALKVLHKPEDSRDAALAETRIKQEIEAMQTITHPNLLKILDIDPDLKWFVSQYHPNGILFNNLNRFTGRFANALRAFRPLVEGITELHKNSVVHRDIKPQNVFLDSSHNLVLGDFGLVFFTDEKHTRISDTMENVGSRDWMPAWAMGIRIEDIKPAFDVFSLGKILWSMVSGKPFLRLWYVNKDEFNLENLFPDDTLMQLANHILRKCVVEEEKECLPDAMALLYEVDQALSIIDSNADLIRPNVTRRCKVCGIGNYELFIDKNVLKLRNFGLSPAGKRSFKIFICNYCGNVQLFAFGESIDPVAWKE